jgi:hypothetical protein
VNVLKAISLKVISALLLAVMSALVRFLGEQYPVGQIVFFRSAFAILPVVLIYAWRNELAAAVRTLRPLGHLGRGCISIFGMFCTFAALARLPIVDATAISFASPLITVALAAILLKARVRIYRWSAVVVGFIGILVMLAPYFDPALHAGTAASTLGLVFAMCSAYARQRDHRPVDNRSMVIDGDLRDLIAEVTIDEAKEGFDQPDLVLGRSRTDFRRDQFGAFALEADRSFEFFVAPRGRTRTRRPLARECAAAILADGSFPFDQATVDRRLFAWRNLDDLHWRPHGPDD